MLDPGTLGVVADVAKAGAAIAGSSDNPVDVKVTGFTWTAAGVWTIVGMIVIAAIKIFPVVYSKWVERDGEVREEKAADKMTQAQRLSALEERVARMSTAIGSLLNATLVGVNGLESEDHATRAMAAEQMRSHVQMAAVTLGKDDPFIDALNKLASTPNVRRSA